MRGSESLERMSLAEAKEGRIVATSVLQLCLKTFKPIVSDDAVIDQRFVGDPHFASLALCSLLALPVLVRGRVNAVNFLAIGTSNQLGEFWAGMMGGLLGVVTAGTLGGSLTVVVALLWMKLFPDLRKADRFEVDDS